jgi:hypothetical protein
VVDLIAGVIARITAAGEPAASSPPTRNSPTATCPAGARLGNPLGFTPAGTSRSTRPACILGRPCSRPAAFPPV